MSGVIEENEKKLQYLPDGQYVYREITTPKRLDNSRYFIFRKIGISTIGFNFQPHTDGQACFRGVLQDNSIINIVNGETIYGRDRRVEREVLPKHEFRRANDENLSYFYKDSLERVSKIYPKSVAIFQECISLFSPANPVVSTPVKPTNLIARYPTNDDFTTLENKLQGNPESLVKLRGNQAAKRRKFQNDWKVRNPAAAKFLGAWYTGDRYFYVFPSTAKGGTCVVTQDANGKLDMKIGVVLNKELRYGGGKGFFWVDRENIVASRDSGSGSLYPIYATFAMPELSENMIGDMERQKCITSLPFQ